MPTAKFEALVILTALTLILMGAYACVRVTILFVSGYSIADAIIAVLLLGAELFVCVHGIGYFLSVVKAERRRRVAAPGFFPRAVGVNTRADGRAAAPAVAVLVCAFNEPEDVLEDTLASVAAMDYPAARIYLVDDSTRAASREGAARVAAAYGARLVHRDARAGFKAGAINDLLPQLDEPYIALLDADQRPLPGWLKELVPRLEAQPDLAFVQTPQVYVNTDGLPVAEAAKFQQAVFFEYICEGKSHSNAMFCCGSNAILRREALLSIGCVVNGRTHFFDETSVTEDFATSFRLHARGWRTDYVNQPYVVGMGPETLPAYFMQQNRWAMGTLGVGLRVARRALTEPRLLRPGQWWEYLLSGTYYFIGVANLIFMVAPILFLLFNARAISTTSNLYLFLFIPYIVSTMNLFFLGMWRRRYAVRGVWLASALSFATFWIYIRAAIVALFGLRRGFGVTPKGVGGAVPLSRLLPELTMLGASAGVALWGLGHLAIAGWSIAYVINTMWAGYHAVLLSTLVVHFNKAVTISPRQPWFGPAARVVAPHLSGGS